jgi:hypothetical protein
MKDILDIDSLLEEINSVSTTNNKGKNKNKKKEETKPKSITTDQIIQTYEAIKLGNPLEVDKNIQEIINPEIVKEVDVESIAENNDTTEMKKKKKKKNKKKTAQPTIDGEKEVVTNVEEKINKYKELFDFSNVEVTNSRFQDNSMFRVLKNWEEKEWNQTYKNINYNKFND